MSTDFPNFLDWQPAGNGSSTDIAKLRDFITYVGKYGKGFIPAPASGLGYYIDEIFEIHNDTASGTLQGVHLIGDLGSPFTPTAKPTIITAVPCPTGGKADITGYGNGGAGQFVHTIYLGSWGGNDYTGQQVTLANKERFIGRSIRIWNAATKEHNGEFFIVGVPACDYVQIHQPNAGAAAKDANDGAIKFRIYMQCWDIRAGEFLIEGIGFQAPPGRWGPMLEIGQPFRDGGSSVNSWAVSRCSFSANTTSKIFRYGLQIAKNFVPRDSSVLGWIGTNGDGVLQVAATTQVDFGLVEYCGFRGADEMSVCHSSPNGQSRFVTFNKCQFGPGMRGFRTVYSNIGYGTPRNTYDVQNRVYNGEGNPGAFFYDCDMNCDLAFLFGGSSAGPRILRGIHSESTRRIMVDLAQSRQVVNFIGGSLHAPAAKPHPSREFMLVKGVGPLNFHGTMLWQVDNEKEHITMEGLHGKVGRVNFFGAELVGTTNWTGRRARKQACLCGPYAISSGETLTFVVDGKDVVVTHTAANFTTAGVTSVDLNEVMSWQLGALWNFYLSAATPSGCAWGEFDNAPPFIESNTEGIGGSIDCRAGSGNLFTVLDWRSAGIPFPGQAQTNMSIDSAGWVDNHGSGAGAEPQVMSVGYFNTDATTQAGNRVVLPEGVMHYGSGVPQNKIVRRALGSFTCTTGGIVTVAGAVVTIADVRVTAKSTIILIPTNAAAVTLGQGYRSTRTAGTSFAFVFPGAPAGTETFDYSIEEPP